MAEEIETIFKHINSGENFLLSGGAGSGKTYSLIEVVNEIYERNPAEKVACITFTNVAVNEINERAPYKRLKVSTIHDFLWDTISKFQTNIKSAIIELIESGTINYYGDTDLKFSDLADKTIQYKEWRKLEEGVISHDEVVSISGYLFSEYELLSEIIKDKYNYLLVDEYQDTFESVIRIVLEHLNKSDKNIIIGLFGDKMQSIYGDRVGDIDSYIEDGKIQKVIKDDNRRNPQIIINLINQLRSDDLTQEKADDPSATNYGVEGEVSFLYTHNDSPDFDDLKQLEFFNDFDSNKPSETKELYLVESLIADKAGFPNLLEVYTKDRILKYKDKIRRHIRKNDLQIDETNNTFGDVIEMVEKEPTELEQDFIDANPDLYKYAKNLTYEDIKSIYTDKDLLIDEKKSISGEDESQKRRDELISHLMQIQDCIYLYKKSNFNRFIRKTNYQITSIEDKRTLRNSIETISEMGTKPIEEVIEYANNNNIWPKDDKFNSFVNKKEYRYKRVKEIPFKEIVNLYRYVEAHTPYSTQHNIKGAEFDNVFVMLDNGKWRSYNFEYLFENDGTESVRKRTQKLFYVCCSRAKKNLVVFYQEPSDKVLETAEEWFGEENIYEIEV